MVTPKNFKKLYPFNYDGKLYHKAQDFINDSAYQIIYHSTPRSRWRSFSSKIWRKMFPESLDLARERGLERAIIGHVNFAHGHPCEEAFAKPVRSSRKGSASGHSAKKPKRKGPRKYPEDTKALIEMLTNLVANLRRRDGSKLQSISDWRSVHAGSHRTAQTAGVHFDVAENLGLEAQTRNFPRLRKEIRASKVPLETPPEDVQRHDPKGIEELRRHLTKLVGDIRLKDGSRITTLKQWTTFGRGSHAAAVKAGIHHDIADALGLQYRKYKSKKPLPAGAAIEDLTATVKGRKKYPTERNELFKHMVTLVSLLRFEDGSKVKSIGDWRKLHFGSYQKARKAGIHFDVAEKLGLEARNRNFPKFRKDAEAIKVTPDTIPEDVRRHHPKDIEELRLHLIKLVGDIRLKDGSKITTLKQWTTFGRGTHAAAVKAGIHHDIADTLGLQYRKYKSKKPMPAEEAIKDLTATTKGPTKYPIDRRELFKHMVTLVSLLRFEDGSKVKSIGDWRKLHHGSYRTAQKAGMHLAVAKVLYLQHPGYNYAFLAGEPDT